MRAGWVVTASKHWRMAAIVKPLADLHVAIKPAALRRIIQYTQGYPYFLLAWLKANIRRLKLAQPLPGAGSPDAR